MKHYISSSITAALAVSAHALFSFTLIGADLESSNHASQNDLTGYAKNLARIHLGSTLSVYDAGTDTYMDTAAAGSWMDDDETTGWTPSAGKSYYLLSLDSPKVLTAFAVSAGDTLGTISLYTGDELASPDSSTWTPVARDVSIQEINEKVSGSTFNQYNRLVLVEVNAESVSPWWSIYLFGREPALAYNLVPRETPVDTSTLYGSDVNPSTLIDTTNIAAGSRVTYASSGGNSVAWQAMIDESPESSFTVAGDSAVTPDLVVKMPKTATINRISALVDAPNGVLEFYIVDELPQEGVESMDLTQNIPVSSLGFDGTSDRESIDFAAAEGEFLLVRWKPAVDGESIDIHQLDSFGDITYDEYEYYSEPENVALVEDNSKGKVVLDEEFKSLLDPIAEGPLSLSPVFPAINTPPLFVDRTPTPTPTPTITPPPTPEGVSE